MKNKILGIKIIPQTKSKILDRVKTHLQNPTSFFHIVSLNPEIIMAAHGDKKFAEILKNAALQHIDGAGLTLAGKILGVKIGERIAGVDLMEELLNFVGTGRCPVPTVRVFFLGGRRGVAEKLAEIFSKKIPQAKFQGTEGCKNVGTGHCPVPTEISSFSPHLLFVSFGSPTQEKWIYENRSYLGNCVAMGVGGAFDFLSGRAPRAPAFIRKIGLEWLWRLILQPWRIKRQLNLLKFIFLICRERALRVPSKRSLL